MDLLVLDQGIDTSTAAGRMFFQIVGSNAAFEQALRSERAVDSLAEARARAHWWAEAEARGSPGAAGQAQVRGVR
ncbi:recombinase family protein [Amycolatopsis sp. FDAARGOS 1241]|nr:recombinase family protein [Amycolatopsis sp. FDAARGOS 1241]